MAGDYDVIIFGGALSGAATGFLLRRHHPGLRVLIVERAEAFDRKVGESTVELSSYYLGKVLGLTPHLLQHHLVKQGLRFWFSNDQCQSFDDCSEIGPGYHVRLPGFQIDRAILDTFQLERAVEAGCELWRPAEVKDVQLSPGGLQQVTVQRGNERQTVSARWVVDATGFARLLARKNSWVERNEAHPISSMWARWKNVTHWEDLDLLDAHPCYAKRCKGTRQTATNHLLGDGWWAWWIPLQGGETSIGIVYDERLSQPPEGANVAERLRRHLEQHPVGRELLKNAEPDLDDVHYRKHLPWLSREVCGDGFCLVGDAAGFIDPFYSPGLDWIAFTTMNALKLIGHERQGMDVAELAAERNRALRLSYWRWFKAIYQDRYYYMGDFELLRLGFRMDLSTYYFGVASQPFKYGSIKGFENPPLTGPHTEVPYATLRRFNRRMVAIGCQRRANGSFGQANKGHNDAFRSYEFDHTLLQRIGWNLLWWGALELKEGWRARQEPEPAGMVPGLAPA
ncbi:MAG: NAD(P)/FAD-dependent oxidoreductase [Verrucomicrobiota bacterium JB022]|nr:NAD(P)/FAD-dependent oxidoreductase [Verrucomicrobiota bacterium JB022]